MLIIGHIFTVYIVNNMGRYKHGRPDSKIELKDLMKRTDVVGLSVMKKAYVALLFWVGCRRSEPLKVLKEEVREDDGALYMTLPAFKGGRRGGDIMLPLHRWGMSEVKKVWELTKSKKRLFPFCSKTGYRVVKKLFPKKTPHWLRHTLITTLREKRDQGLITTDQIKAYTGITQDSTIERYGLKTHAGVEKVASVLD